MRATTKGGRTPDLDDGEAFLPDPRRVGSITPRDAMVDMVATDFIRSATSAEEQGEAVRDEVTSDEMGGPFVEVSGSQEFANHDEDGSELESDDKEPFPTAMRGATR